MLVVVRYAALVWRRFKHLLVNAAAAIPGLLLVVGLLGVLVLCVFGVGLRLLPTWVRLLRVFASTERRRAGALSGTAIPEHYVALTTDPSGRPVRPLSRLRPALADPTTWRDLAWLLTAIILGPALLWLDLALWALALTGLSMPFVWRTYPIGAEPTYFLVPIDSSVDAALAGGIGGLAVAAVAAFTTVLLPRSHTMLARALLRPAPRPMERVEGFPVDGTDAARRRWAESTPPTGERLPRTQGTVTRYVALAWRRSGYLVKSAAAAIPGLLLLLGLVGLPPLSLVVGLLLLPWWVRLLRRFASMERRRVGAMLGATIPERYVSLDTDLPGSFVRRHLARLRRAFTDPATWRDMTWVILEIILGPLFVAAVVLLWGGAISALAPIGWMAQPDSPQPPSWIFYPIDSWWDVVAVTGVGTPVLAAFAAFATVVLARTHAALARAWLRPSRLVERVEELSTTRAEALDAHGSELARIERDLHDGTQARLVSLALRLGVAEERFADDPEAAMRLVREARDGATEALTELRDVVRGIHPPILTDRGLSGAVSAVAAHSVVPVTVEADGVGRLPAAVESAAYFVVTEAMTNIARHSGCGPRCRTARPGGRLSGGGGTRRWARRSGRGSRQRLGRHPPPGRGLRRPYLAVQPAWRADGTARGDPVRVVIAEDHALLREGLTLLLNQFGCEVAAAVSSAPELVDAALDHAPDVAVVDVRLPPAFRDEGLRAAVEVRRRSPEQPVLVLSQYVERAYASELLADGRGGIGYLLKDRVGHAREFVDALRRVAAGGTAMDPEVISQLLVGGDDADPLGTLTAREREVLALMAEGHANADIAQRLFVTERAVHKHIANIFRKLDLPAEDGGGHRRVRAVLAYLNAPHHGRPTD